jgi:subtilase family serine protease
MPKRRKPDRHAPILPASIESMERRLLFSAFPLTKLQPTPKPVQVPSPSILFGPFRPFDPVANAGPVANPIAVIAQVSPDNSPGASWLTPSEIDDAYGINLINFGSIQGDGAGQTIAIVDAYDDPNAASDLQTFDAEYGLPNPTFQRLNQSGVAGSYPSADSTGGWEVEESLDIEWAHAIAPLANIDLIEANNNGTSSLFSAVNTARDLPGVVAVSTSWGGNEFSSETLYDSTYFTTPTGHGGVTFVASSGDDGAPGVYPAFSPNVLAVGGTSLTLNASGGYGSESGWSGSGGGISQYESQPAYQKGVVTQSTTQRTSPDVAMDADPNTGVSVYDSYDQSNPWLQIGGTSVGSPIWSGLIAIADQGRMLANLNSLDGPTQTLPDIYALPESDFNDITTGNNGYAAGPGYDLVTGRGSPKANLLVPALAGAGSIAGVVYQDNNSNGVIDSGEPGLAGTTVYLDSNNNGVLDAPTNHTYNATGLPQNIPHDNSNGLSSTITVSGSTLPITSVSLTLNINNTVDADLNAYLSGPNGATIALFNQGAVTGQNFTNTVFSNSASTLITSGAAPYTGTFLPNPGEMWLFNGASANGTWTLNVADSVSGDTGSLQSWSLSITTGETSVTTAANGSYVFNSEPIGSYVVRQVVPANEVQTSPAAANDVTLTSTGATGENFGDFPTLITDNTTAANYYLVLKSGGSTLQIYNTATPSGTPAYQVPLADLPSLTFSLLGAGDNVTVDYTNGNPVPTGNLSLLAPADSTDQLNILGNSPTETFTMTDTQIGLTDQPAVLFQDFSTLSLNDCTVNYTGTLSTLNNLDIGVTATFNWV